MRFPVSSEDERGDGLTTKIFHKHHLEYTSAQGRREVLEQNWGITARISSFAEHFTVWGIVRA